jgi:hypothetical protein
MTVGELTKKLNAKEINLVDGDREISVGYCGDFLSFVMGKAKSDCAWFTIMTNVNVAAVATLAEVAVVVVCESCVCDINLIEKTFQKGINLIETDLDVFSAVLAAFGK